MHLVNRLAFACLFVFSSAALAQAPAAPSYANADPHASPEWALVAPHLPDPLSASPERLETAGDVLRARRFPEDALTFYKAAVLRGGNANRLLKKQGVLHLEMQHGVIARLSFQGAIKLNKKDPEAWNNLGAADFMLGNTHTAIGEYKRAVKLNRNSAIYHSNLALAYFEVRDARGARQELARAFAIDPDVLHHSGTSGYNLQILASSHYAEICYEMARVYGAQGDQQATISWLTKASERGFDVRSAMASDPVLRAYLQNEEVKIMLANVNQLHTRELAGKGKPPALSPASSR